jgi:trans-aconitate methyltransferase
MANDHQFRARTAFVATRGVREYRATIPHVLRPEDVVLEVGCEWGTTTTLLAGHAASVLGTDVSRECVARARVMHPVVEFAVLDAFDLRAVLDLGRPFTAVYMDLSGLSGYRGLLDLVALLNAYSAVLAPRVVVVKSGALKDFARRCTAWPAAEEATC